VKPKITMGFENKTPCFIGGILRIEVRNEGKIEAKNCVVKLRIFDENNNKVQDGHILHWSKHIPIMVNSQTYIETQYEPITIASKDSEYLDCLIHLYFKKGLGDQLGIYSYPYTWGGSINLTDLPKAETRNFRVKLTFFGDSTKPAKFSFYYTITNDKLSIGEKTESLKEVKICN
jgi:hypothetical protein